MQNVRNSQIQTKREHTAAEKGEQPLEGITIFLSSTCYDLIDLRSVLIDALQQDGYRVIASDFSGSAFALSPKLNSVEVCLDNVRTSDLFLLVLDRRYGPSVPDYIPKSATHLEYDEAIRLGLPILTFVRSGFARDHRTWQKMVRSGTSNDLIASSLVHVDTTHHVTFYEFERLFNFYDEVRRASIPGKPNWVETYATARDLVDIARQRVGELMRAETFKLERLIRAVSATQAHVPLLFSQELTATILQRIGHLNLTSDEMLLVANTGLKYAMDIEPLLAIWDAALRDKFLCDHIETLMAKNWDSTLQAFSSPAVVNALRQWTVQHSSFDCFLSAWRVSKGRLGLGGPNARPLLHSILQRPFPVEYFGFEEKAMALHTNKKSALEILANAGDKSDCAVTVRCLAYRGIPILSGDPEHIKYSDPPATIDYYKEDELTRTAFSTLSQLHDQGICFAAPLTATIIRDLQSTSLKINILRAIAQICPKAIAEKEILFEEFIRLFPREPLLQELFQDCSSAGIVLEEMLLRLCDEPHLRAACLDGLIWHSSSRSVQPLLFALQSWSTGLEEAAWVLRFLIDEATRETISISLRKRILELVSRNEMHGGIIRIIECLGAADLIDILEAFEQHSECRDYERKCVMLAKESIHNVEKGRLSGSGRQPRRQVCMCHSQQTFAHELNCVQKDFANLKHFYNSADLGACASSSQDGRHATQVKS